MLSKLNLVLFIIIFIHILLLTKLIYFPYPELFIYPYLTNNGLKPYSDILDQHFPGLMFLPINFDNLGMTTPDIARIWSMGIVMFTHLMIFIFTKKIFNNRINPLFVNMLYLIWQPFFEGWVLWIDNFLPLLLLPAIYFLKTKQYLYSGLLIGTAVVFKQILIPLSAFIGVYLLFKERKINKIFPYILGFSLPMLIMLGYFFYIGTFKDFWFWTVIFNLTTYAQSGRGDSPSLAHLTRVIVVFGSALVVVRKIKEEMGQLLLLFLVGTLLGLTTRFDFVHFQPALPFALLAFVYGLQGLKKFSYFFLIVYCMLAVWWLSIFYKGHVGDKVIFFESQTLQTAERIKQLTKSKEKIFVFGAPPHLYQMTDTLPSGNIFVFQFPWFIKVAETRILDGIKRGQPNIVVADRTLIIEGQKITEFAPNIDQYLQQNYQRIDSIGSTEILRRKSN